MIWALLAAYFLGGGLGGVQGSLLTSSAVKQLSQMSETIVSEPGRAEAAQQILKELRKEISGFEKKFKKAGRELNRSYKSHEADEEQALEILRQLNSDWEIMQDNAIDLRFQLRDRMTEEEWVELFQVAERQLENPAS